MSTISVFGYAKVNFYLEAKQRDDGFHELDSVVGTINLRDRVTLSMRKDKLVKLKAQHGIKIVGENNAVKAAQLFVDKANCCGVDISIYKTIPVGAGLGGSSADISAVLMGMRRLYGDKVNIYELANMLSSDASYQIDGGFARLKGKGEKITRFETDKTFYLVVIPLSEGVSTKTCYSTLDNLVAENDDRVIPPTNGAERVISALKSGDIKSTNFFNALYPPSCELNNAIKNSYDDLKALCPDAVFMTGSGSAVCGVFMYEELCDWALSKLKAKYKNAFITRTLSFEEVKKYSRTRSLYSLDNEWV